MARGSQQFPICLVIAEPVRSSRLELVLQKDGFEILTFRSARELWDNFERRRPRYIITDRRFADEFSGLDLCRRIRERFMLPYVYIHVLGRVGPLEEVDEALDSGADDFSAKPLTPFHLRARVHVGLRWLNYIDSITVPASRAKKSA